MVVIPLESYEGSVCKYLQSHFQKLSIGLYVHYMAFIGDILLFICKTAADAQSWGPIDRRRGGLASLAGMIDASVV